VEVARFVITRLSQEESPWKTAAVFVPLPEAFTQKPSQSGSVGEVEETKTANPVEGEDVGLPFSAFMSVSVEVEGAERVGAPGTLAAV
jgi:hypothetical protein